MDDLPQRAERGLFLSGIGMVVAGVLGYLLRRFGLGDNEGLVGLALIVASLAYWSAYAARKRRDTSRD